METGRNGNPARRRISGNNSGVEGLCGTIGKGEHRIILIVDEQPIACEFEKD